jgi:hypothetical protein
MHTGQTILTIAAMTILVLAILNFNRNLTKVSDSLDQERFKLEALSMLSSYVEMTSQHYFDEASTDTSVAAVLGDFTPPKFLGMEANDTTGFDDFDDYHGVTLQDTGRSGLVYNVSFRVDYIRLVGTSVVSSGNQEYSKRMQISITDSYDPPLLFKPSDPAVHDTVQLSFILSYWFYN